MNSESTKPRFSLFDELDRGLNLLVNEVLQQDTGKEHSPRLSVYEFDEKYVVECDLPGVNLEDIDLDIEDGVLAIIGERRNTVPDDVKVTVDERTFSKFTRKLKLDKDIKTDAVDAEFGNGVLKVTIPKPESRAARSIRIRTSEQ